MLEVLYFGKGFRTYHRTNSNRICWVEDDPGSIGRQELFYLLFFRNIYLFHRVGQNKAIHTNHYWNRKFFGNPERLYMQIRGFLVVLSEQLQPPGFALTHGVGVVIPNVDRPADRPVSHRHYDGQP